MKRGKGKGRNQSKKKEKEKDLKSLTEEEKEILYYNEVSYFMVEYEKIWEKRFKDSGGNHATALHPTLGSMAELEALLIKADMTKKLLLHADNTPPFLLEGLESRAKEHALELFKKTSRVRLNAFHKIKKQKAYASGEIRRKKMKGVTDDDAKERERREKKRGEFD
jgi:hypothetical protein